MTDRPYTTRLSALLLTIAVIAGGLQATAQRAVTVDEEIVIPVGSVFEILADTDLNEASFSWVFNQGQTFLQAGRDQSFRVRLTKTGTYTLAAEVSDTNGTSQTQKRFQIRVRNRTAADDRQAVIDESLLVSTMPTRDAMGRLVLGTGKHVVRLEPDPNLNRTLLLDLDADVDRNRDGNSENDNQVQNTFFASKYTPLHIWFTKPVESRTLLLALSGGGRTEEIAIRSPQLAAKEDREAEQLERENPEVLVKPMHNGQVGFALELLDKSYRSTPLLLHWHFGDGAQSLLDRPLHTYAANGSYDVRVTVFDLTSGQELDEFVTIARVDSVTTAGGTTDGSEGGATAGQTEEDPEPTPSTSKRSGSWLGLLFKILLIALLSIGFGFAIVFVVGLLKKRGSLSETLEKVEDKLLKTDDQEPASEDVIDTTPPPMAMPETEATTTEAPTEPTPDTAEPTDAQTPSWLQADTDQTATEAPVDSPPPATPEADTAAEPSADTPAWLQTEPSSPATDEPAPSSESTEAAATPSWLQSGMDQAAAEGQTSDSPPPPELQEQPAATPPSDDGTPSWLQPASDAPDATISTDTAAEPAADAATPDWLQPSADTTPAATEPTQQPAPADGATPDWLQPSPDTAAAATEPTATPEPAAAPAEPAAAEAPAPDWLQPAAEATEPAAEAAQPDWLNQPTETGTPDATTETAPLASTDAPAPDWLQPSSEPATTPPEPPTTPAPASEPSTQPTEPNAPAGDDSVPDWLQPTADATTAEASTQVSEPATEEISATKAPEEQPSSESSDSSDSSESSPAPEPTTESEQTPKDWSQMTKEEKERERKRQKRRRYRQNKRAREKEEKTTSEPTAADLDSADPSSVVTPTPDAVPTEPEVPAAPEPAVDTPSAEPAPEQPAATQEQEIPQASEDEVQFLISADSLSEENGQTPPEGTEDADENQAA